MNERRGDAMRADLWAKTQRVLERLDRARRPDAEPRTACRSSRCRSRRPSRSATSGRFLFENGIYVTLAAYPLVPRSEVGFRVQLTAANTDAEIDQLIDVLGKLANAFDLQPARSRPRHDARAPDRARASDALGLVHRRDDRC